MPTVRGIATGATERVVPLPPPGGVWPERREGPVPFE